MGGSQGKAAAAVQARLADAALAGDAAEIRKLIAEGGNPTSSTGGRIPLHLACTRAVFRFNTAYLEALLAAPTVQVNIVDDHGRTALHAALQGAQNTPPRQHVNLAFAVEVLLRAGVDINARTKHGETALHFAARLGKFMVKELLNAGADVTATTVFDSNALAYAVSARRYDAARALLAAGASPNTNTSPSLKIRIPLILVALQEPELFANLLDAGADPAVLRRPLDGATQLFHANSVPVLRRLLALGLDVNARNKAGDTALLFHMEDPDAVHLLLEAGIDVNAQDKQGRTVMHRVATARDACQRPSYQRTVELLLDYGADVTIVATSGLTAADMARTMSNRWLRDRILKPRKCVKLL